MEKRPPKRYTKSIQGHPNFQEISCIDLHSEPHV